MEGEKPDAIAESDTEQNPERKAEEEGAESRNLDSDCPPAEETEEDCSQCHPERVP